MERVWDFTTLDTFQTCRRKYYWFAVRHLQTRTKSNALLFGGAIHDALDTHYAERDMAKAITNFKATYKDREGDDLRTVANGAKLLENYARVYEKEPFELLNKPEAGFVFPIGDIMYGGRMDLPVRWDGAIWIMEHKTTSVIRSTYFRQFDLDKQVTGYIVAAEAFTGEKCIGCLINALEPWKELKRPTARSKKPEDHFQRYPVTRSPMLKERFKLNVNRLVRDILWCEENNEFYEAEKKEACFYYNYDCPYKMLCQYGDDPRMIKKEYVVQKWQPYKLESKETIADEVNKTVQEKGGE